MVDTLLEHFKAYDIEATPKYSNHFVDIMASLGSLIPQNPFRKVTHVKVITMYNSYLELSLYQKDPPP